MSEPTSPPSRRGSAVRERLTRASLEVILAGQTPEGAYLAAPTYPTYRYGWFRDGSFIAEAAEAWGEPASAAAFHAWVVRTLARHLPGVLRGLEGATPVGTHPPGSVLHTRYLADGSPGGEEWPNFQLDGFGTWLWAFGRHVAAGGAFDDAARAVVRDLAAYLAATWSLPNYDCWEERPDRVHPSTLGALVAGLRAAAGLLDDPRPAGTAEAVRAYLLAWGVRGGAFVKHVGDDDVDANLLWLNVPYAVLPAGHAVARRTAERVRSRLMDPDGGVHRHPRDTYYGGGSWPLLTAALARDALSVGRRDDALELLATIEGTADDDGALPEQTSEHLLAPERKAEWDGRWGPSARPLLWSHAAYLMLVRAVREGA